MTPRQPALTLALVVATGFILGACLSTSDDGDLAAAQQAARAPPLPDAGTCDPDSKGTSTLATCQYKWADFPTLKDRGSTCTSDDAGYRIQCHVDAICESYLVLTPDICGLPNYWRDGNPCPGTNGTYDTFPDWYSAVITGDGECFPNPGNVCEWSAADSEQHNPCNRTGDAGYFERYGVCCVDTTPRQEEE
jgi:hypothetical protein